jgi:DNA-binding FadR family transcriptional regulator
MSPSIGTPPPRFSANARLRALQGDIMDLIIERELSPGDALPTESELSLALGVGRNTLRESLKVLQAMGVVEIRHGFGMFVATNNFAALADGLAFRGRLSLRYEGREALQLVEARQRLEAGLVGASMELATEVHIAEIGNAVVEMEEAASRNEPEDETGTDFHHLLFAPLENPILLELTAAFREVSRELRSELGTLTSHSDRRIAAHRNIYEAFKSGDEAGAANHLNEHFAEIRSSISTHIGDRQANSPLNSP